MSKSSKNIRKIWAELTVGEQKIAIGISILIAIGIAVRWWHIIIRSAS